MPPLRTRTSCPSKTAANSSFTQSGPISPNYSFSKNAVSAIFTKLVLEIGLRQAALLAASIMRQDDDNIELLIKVFDNQQTIISNADTKANISISIQTFIITSVLGASIITDTFNHINSLGTFTKGRYYILFSAFLVTSILGLINCALVFKPRLPQEKKEIERKGITYFGHIVKFKSSEQYYEAIKDTSTSDIVKEFAAQNYSLSIILNSKMKYVKKSINFLFANISLGVVLLLISLLTK